MKRIMWALLALFLQSRNEPRMRDPSFESIPAGTLASTGTVTEGWEIQRQGRPEIQDRLVVTCLEDAARARTGKKCLLLSIPKDTVGFEFVTVGQRHALPRGLEVEATVWVRWADGPDQAPAGAGALSGHPSAIVSFWARHRDGAGDFAGRDDWLFDNRWTRLSFRLRATDPDRRTLFYVSLLPNQKPADTRVLVDDFELVASPAPSEEEPRRGNLVADPSFEIRDGDGAGDHELRVRVALAAPGAAAGGKVRGRRPAALGQLRPGRPRADRQLRPLPRDLEDVVRPHRPGPGEERRMEPLPVRPHPSLRRPLETLSSVQRMGQRRQRGQRLRRRHQLHSAGGQVGRFPA